MNKLPQVKNRAPAPIQISAEQLLREARDRGIEDAPKAPKQYITDQEELTAYRQGKRKEFEDILRNSRTNMGMWVKYGLWEADQKEFDRARSVFERALDIEYRNEYVWNKYAEMEMKNKFVNHARNVFDRCVTLLPRHDAFWYKYTYMEELAGSIETARQVFERFMAWEPDDNGWSAFIKFEQRHGETSRVRAIFERYVSCHPTCRAYLKYAKWEEVNRQLGNARAVFERSVESIHPSERNESLLLGFARFEERCKEVDRARAIYRFALTSLSASTDQKALEDINRELVAFEKRHGDRQDIEGAILAKRRQAYEEALSRNNFDYDAWFDYARLEENEFRESLALLSPAADSDGDGGGDSSEMALDAGVTAATATSKALERVREVYERAVAAIPLSREKRFWRRYIYLWLTYALFEELVARDVARARAVYAACLAVIPHKHLTFSKIWLQAAFLEVRCKDLAAARRLLGQALGVCSQYNHHKQSIFRGYASLELQLGEIDRCRKVYAKYIEVMPFCVKAWCDFAGLERTVGETVRARSIFEVAVEQPQLDAPEVLWKAYIDFETEEREHAKVRALYERLLQRAGHVKVWIAFALFEASLAAEASSSSDAGAGAVAGAGVDRATETALASRKVLASAYSALKSEGLKEERVLLLEAWRSIETALPPTVRDLAKPEGMMPRKIKARRMVTDESGQELGWEEYYDYVFPDDEKKVTGLKILENALKWKAAMGAGAGAGAGADADKVDDESSSSSSSSLGKRKAEEELNIDDV
jgi:crooked neck